MVHHDVEILIGEISLPVPEGKTLVSTNYGFVKETRSPCMSPPYFGGGF
jgi:hypothetical protein